MAGTWNLLGLNGTGDYAYATGEIPVWNDTLKRFEPGSGSGTGDVVGPAGATDDHVVTFDGATGKLIQDSGKTILDIQDEVADVFEAPEYITVGDETAVLPNSRQLVAGANITLDTTTPGEIEISAATGGGGVTGPASSGDEQIPLFDGATGGVLKDSGFTISDLTAEIVGAAFDQIVPVEPSMMYAPGGGTPDNTTFYRGDGAWATPSGAGDVTGPSVSDAGNLVEFADSTGKVLRESFWSIESILLAAHQAALAELAGVRRFSFGWSIGNGTDVISTGTQTGALRMPMRDGVIERVSIVCSDASLTSGSIQLDIKKARFATTGLSFSSIVASDPPAISSAQATEKITFNGWTLRFGGGDLFQISVTSVTSMTQVMVLVEGSVF